MAFHFLGDCINSSSFCHCIQNRNWKFDIQQTFRVRVRMASDLGSVRVEQSQLNAMTNL